MPLHAPMAYSTTERLVLSLQYAYIIFTFAYCPVSTAFNVKNLHTCFWTKMSVLASIPRQNNGQKCPFWRLKFKVLTQGCTNFPKILEATSKF